MIVIHRFGDVTSGVLEDLAMDLDIFNATTEIGGLLPTPPEAYDEERGQHISDVLLAVAAAQKGDRILCVAPFDMYSEPLNFVFGQAEIGGRAALISIARLGDRDRQKFRDRVAKEAVHELGHTFGVNHCPNKTCVMHFSNSLADTDIKSKFYCDECVSKIPTSWRQRQR